MNRLANYLRNWFGTLVRAFADEIHLSLHDWGVIIFFFVVPLAYPIVYTLIYNPEVVTKIPVAVVDHDRSADSRHLARMVSASPAIQIYSYCNNISEAKDQMAAGDVYGVLEIPADYAERLGSGSQAVVQFYSDASLLLRYRTFTAALSDLQLQLASDITTQRVAMLGAASEELSLPVTSRSNFLGDTEQGFASFVIPGIVVLILQQSMLLGICMIWGTRKERRRRRQLLPQDSHSGRASALVLGRSLAAVFMYVPGTIYILHFIPWMFRLPQCGDLLTALLFIFPMLLGVAFMGQALGPMMRERESGFMYLVFFSPVLLFLSGLTWPRYAMNGFWKFCSDIFPATWGVEGFVRINSTAATLHEVSHAYYMLWLLAAAYFVLALIMQRRYARRTDRIMAGTAA